MPRARSTTLSPRPGLVVQPPGLKAVDPPLDRIDIPPELAHGEFGAPPVVPKGHHRHLGPSAFRLVAVANDACDCVMPVGENIGLDGHLLSKRTLGWEAPGPDFRRHGLDSHPAPPVRLAVRRFGGPNR